MTPLLVCIVVGRGEVVATLLVVVSLVADLLAVCLGVRATMMAAQRLKLRERGRRKSGEMEGEDAVKSLYWDICSIIQALTNLPIYHGIGETQKVSNPQ